MKCQKCPKYDAQFEMFDTTTGETINICSFCESDREDDYVLLKVLGVIEEPEFVPNPKDKNLNNFNSRLVVSDGVSYGRLHIVGKTRKAALCRVCKKVIPVGSKCYNQAIMTEPYPTPTKVCLNCGDKL